VTRPVAQLLGFHRVHLEVGACADVTFTVPPARLAFTDRGGRRVVEPGELRVWVGASVADHATEVTVSLTGGVHAVTLQDERCVVSQATETTGTTRATGTTPAP